MAIINHIGLFEGIGGFSLAARWMGWETIAWCEWNEFGQKVLKHHFPKAQPHGDITKTDFTIYRGQCDVLTGGFPCQDASQAKQDGKGQQGLQGERTRLFYEMCRAIREIRPKYIVAENVENILRTNGGKDFSAILTELSGMGYNAEWKVCRASDVGAPHHRSRLYLVAYSNSNRISKGQSFFSNVDTKASQIPWRAFGTTIQTFRGGAWLGEPPIICVDDGVSNGSLGFSASRLRKEKLKAAGNAIVPQVAFQIFKAIEQYDMDTKIPPIAQ
jgi:DNA (cytosine-5)-methyltransferase 1